MNVIYKRRIWQKFMLSINISTNTPIIAFVCLDFAEIIY